MGLLRDEKLQRPDIVPPERLRSRCKQAVHVLLGLLFSCLGFSSLAHAQSPSDGLATYDAGTGILHIPSVQYHGDYLWADLRYDESSGLVTLVGSGPTDDTLSYVNFAPDSGKALVPYIAVAGTQPAELSRYAAGLAAVSWSPELTFQLEFIQRHQLQRIALAGSDIGIVAYNEQGEYLFIFGAGEMASFSPRGSVYVRDSLFATTLFLDGAQRPAGLVNRDYAVLFSGHTPTAVDITRTGPNEVLAFGRQPFQLPAPGPHVSRSDLLANLARAHGLASCTSAGIEELYTTASPSFGRGLQQACGSFLLLTAAVLANEALAGDTVAIADELMCTVSAAASLELPSCAAGVIALVARATEQMQAAETTYKDALVAITPPGPTGPLPSITSFSASPSVLVAAQPSLFSWEVDGADSCSIDNGVGVVACTDSMVLTPGTSLTYRLSASANGGTVAATTNVTAGEPGRFVYVTDATSDNLAMYSIDSVTGGLATIGAGTVSAGDAPWGIAVAASGRYAYATNYNGDSISMYIIDPVTGALTANGAIAAINETRNVVVDPTERYVYAVNQSSNMVSMYTIGTDGQLTANGSVATGGTTAVDIVTDPLGRYAYVTNADSNSLTMYVIAADGTLTSQGTVVTVTSPRGLDVSPGGKFLYVGAGNAHTIGMFTISGTGTLTPIGGGTIAFPDGNSRPNDLAVDPSGRYLYAVDNNNFINQVRAFSIDSDTGQLTDLGAVASENTPNAIAVDPSGQFVYVTNQVSGSVSMYAINGDGTLSANGVLGPLGGTPRGIAISR